MSQIAILINDPVTSTVLLGLKNIIAGGLGDLKQKIEKQEPIYSCDLFDNDHNENSEKLLSLCAVLEDNQVSYGIYELETGETFNQNDALAHQIPLSTLKNIMGSFDREVERQGRS